MKKETETICKIKKNGLECKGGLFKVIISKLEDSLNHRVYKCDRCDIKYKFIN